MKYYNVLILLFVNTAISVHAQQAYREKYADVISYYSRQDKDSLKKKAAFYLIDNMDGHTSPEGAPIDDFIRRVGNMKKSNGIRQLQSEWSNASKAGAVAISPDSSVIDSSYLINSIESAFEAWEESAWKDKITFGLFCEYILPYRINDEHIGVEWRKALRQQYMPLIEGVLDIKKAFAIVRDSVYKDVVLSNDYCPYALDPLTCLTIGRAECSQRCILLAAVLRSLCIPAVVDGTPMWADYSNKGHAWVAMVASNGDTYTVYEKDKEAKLFNPVDASEFLPRYRIKAEDKCPYSIKTTKTPVKVYRHSYERYNAFIKQTEIFSNPFWKDVSERYGLLSDVVFNVEPRDSLVFLCCYLSGVDWMPVAKAENKNGVVRFRNVGKGTVCTIATVRNGRRFFLSHPFLVGEGGIERFFIPSNEEKESVVVDRKYPLCSYTTDTWGFMKGGTFEGSMTNDFQDCDTIAMITTMPYGMTTIDCPSTKKYRYLRYHAPVNNRSSLAELQFYTFDAAGNIQLLQGTYFCSGADSTMLANAFDGNLSTICKGLRVGYTIGVDLGEGKEAYVTKTRFCPSTDLNFVEPRHLYELYCFDTDWHLVGRVFSKGSNLTFDHVPKGVIFLLKDKSSGKEERIFEYNNKQQIWH